MSFKIEFWYVTVYVGSGFLRHRAAGVKFLARFKILAKVARFSGVDCADSGYFWHLGCHRHGARALGFSSSESMESAASAFTCGGSAFFRGHPLLLYIYLGSDTLFREGLTNERVHAVITRRGYYYGHR